MKPAAVSALLFGLIACVTAACGSRSEDMTFFITSVPVGDGGNLGGIAAADAHCQKLAEAAGAGTRTWRAYLSASATGTTPAIHARDRIGSGPWHNARGVLIASNLEELHGSGNNINISTARHQNGSQARSFHDMLTGSESDGTLAAGDSTCRNWTSTTGHAVVGHSDRQGPGPTGSSWNSAHLSEGCSLAEFKGANGTGYFYCFAVK